MAQPQLDRLLDELRPSSIPSFEHQHMLRGVRANLLGAEAQPTRLGRLTILEAVGRGGMGTVYAAFDPQLDRKVAVKLLHRRDDQAKGRILREARALAQITHPNVVVVFDAQAQGDTVYIVMEFVVGATLRHWLQTSPTTPRVIATMLGAGRGLGAAHRAGIVHGDFKPDNVLVSDDALAKVVDFGLARSGSADEPITAGSSDAGPGTTGAAARGLGGTRGYAAPEVVQGVECGPAADQFSFAVTVWEGLAGRRPFSPDEIKAGVEPALDTLRLPGVSRRIAGALRRALSFDPTRRFATMDELLRQLAPRRRSAVVVAMAAVAGATATAAAMSLPGAEICPDARGDLDGVWTDAARAHLQAAADASSAAWAPTARQRAVDQLDRYIERWSTTHREVCSTHERHETSAELLDRGMACLERRRGQFTALVDTLPTLAPDELDAMGRAAASLPAPEPCGQGSFLLAAVEPPADPELAATVGLVRAELDHAQALLDLGRYAHAVEIHDRLLDDARRSGYAPLEAEVLVRRGKGRLGTGEVEAGAADLEASLWTAYAAADDRTVADAAATLVYVHGFALHRYAEAETYARLATQTIERAGLGAGIRGPLEGNLGELRLEQGHPDRALEHFVVQRRLALEHGAEGSATEGLLGMGRAYEDLGQPQRAREVYEEVLAITERTHGAAHPDVAMVLLDLGNVLKDLGDIEAADAVYRRGYSIARAAVGQQHPLVAAAASNIGSVARMRGDLDAAQAAIRESLDIRIAVYGPSHPEVAKARNILGNVLMARGDLPAARVQIEQALAIEQKIRGSHPLVAQMLHGLGELGRMQGKLDDAQARFEEAAAMFDATVGPDDPSGAYPRVGLGMILLRRGRPADAIETLEAALARLSTGRFPPDVMGEARFALARALGDSGRDPKRARVLAEQAAGDYAGAAGNHAEAQQAIAQWLQRLAASP